ncbi:hypothetical protein BC939DRAFT_505534 [Gamsiella multidivaricata]|uniref:uncharacterized protein n=1 Tax=Gamsiella multidivaricata TaxID=101098 RepID=UPI00221FE3FD|nr:uncharacterized protein BC939DRAFT_505534 [Gamsiella multidivaricata]KAI7819697.1 hypothetical protein BC939DRAFT_505534 [Gamsiella multidivaricata]
MTTDTEFERLIQEMKICTQTIDELLLQNREILMRKENDYRLRQRQRQQQERHELSPADVQRQAQLDQFHRYQLKWQRERQEWEQQQQKMREALEPDLKVWKELADRIRTIEGDV